MGPGKGPSAPSQKEHPHIWIRITSDTEINKLPLEFWWERSEYMSFVTIWTEREIALTK